MQQRLGALVDLRLGKPATLASALNCVNEMAEIQEHQPKNARPAYLMYRMLRVLKQVGEFGCLSRWVRIERRDMVDD